MIFVGLGLALGNWTGLLALLACVGVAYAYRISVEESVLAATLGEPYQQYMRHTRRLGSIPILARLADYFRKRLFQASSKDFLGVILKITAKPKRRTIGMA